MLCEDCRFELLRSGEPFHPVWRRCPWRCSPWTVLVAPQVPGYHLLLPGAGRAAVAPGRVAVIPSEVVHAYEVVDPQATPCLFVHVRYMVARQNDLLAVLDLPSVLAGEPAARVVAHMRALHRIGTATTTLANTARQMALGFELLADLAMAQRNGDHVADPLASARLLPAIRHIDRQIGEPIAVVDLAAALACSPAAVHRLFRRHAGITPMRFVWNRRLATARDLLLMSSQPITRIAVSCGFTDPYHFSRAFKQRYGASPSAFREGYQADHGVKDGSAAREESS